MPSREAFSIIRWIVSAVINAGLLVLWLGYHMVWAHNIWVFLLWLGVVTVVILSLDKYTKSRIGTTYDGFPTSVPIAIQSFEALAYACALAAFGHWFYAAVSIITDFVFMDVRKPVRRRRGPVAQPE